MHLNRLQANWVALFTQQCLTSVAMSFVKNHQYLNIINIKMQTYKYLLLLIIKLLCRLIKYLIVLLTCFQGQKMYIECVYIQLQSVTEWRTTTYI